MKKDTISKIYFMNESTSFLSLFSPRNKTFMKACQRTRKSCANTARGRVFALLHHQTPTRVQFV